MNTELLNRINMNDVYVKKFINNATDEQMGFFDIAAKLLSNNNDMSVIFDYTDDEHLRLITNKLIEYKNSEFVQRLKNVKYIEDIKELVTIMPNDDVFDTYIMSIVKQNDEYNDLRKNNSDLSWDEIERKYPEDRSEMSEEREMLFVNDCFECFEKEGFAKKFWSPFGDDKERIGQSFKIVGRCSTKDSDLSSLPMWNIKFSDGTVIGAYPEEIIPREMKENGCPLEGNELAAYVAEGECKGYSVTSVTRICTDGSRPRVAVKSNPYYKKTIIKDR